MLGASHDIHGSKIPRILCAENETRTDPRHIVLKAFWQVRPDAKLAIGQVAPAGGKPRKDMTGVYSKLQAWRVFDEGPCRYDKVLLMDGSMCVASNVDEIFENEAPAAVVNSDADFTRKDLPAGEFHFRSKTSTWRTTEGETMKSGINGGLVLLEPSTKVFEDMIRELTVKKRQQIWEHTSSSAGIGDASPGSGMSCPESSTFGSTTCFRQVVRGTQSGSGVRHRTGGRCSIQRTS